MSSKHFGSLLLAIGKCLVLGQRKNIYQDSKQCSFVRFASQCWSCCAWVISQPDDILSTRFSPKAVKCHNQSTTYEKVKISNIPFCGTEQKLVTRNVKEMVTAVEGTGDICQIGEREGKILPSVAALSKRGVLQEAVGEELRGHKQAIKVTLEV